MVVKGSAFFPSSDPPSERSGLPALSLLSTSPLPGPGACRLLEPGRRLLCHRIHDGLWLLISGMDTAMSEFLSYRRELRTHFHSISIKYLLIFVNTDLDSCELIRGKRVGIFLAPRALQLAVLLRALLGLSPLSLCSCYGHIPPGFKNKQLKINF